MSDARIVQVLSTLVGEDPATAWEAFLDHHAADVLQVVQATAGEDHAAECFLYVCERLAAQGGEALRRFQPGRGCSFDTWLQVVAQQLSREWQERRGAFRLLERGRVEGVSAAPGSEQPPLPHPDPIEIAAHIDGPPALRERLAPHLRLCDECRVTAATVLREHERAALAVPPALRSAARARCPARRQTATTGRLARILADMAVAAPVLVALLVWQRPYPPVDLRAGDRLVNPLAAFERRLEHEPLPPTLLSPGDRAVVRGTPLTIRWTPVPAAAFYTVRLTAEDGSLVWEATVTDVEATVPAGVPLGAGRSYSILLSTSLPGQRTLAPAATRFVTPPL